MLKSFNIYAVLKLELYVFGYLMEFLLGGAMKPTTDGRWAHLACAMWIPGLFVYAFIYSFFSLVWLCLLSVKFFARNLLS